MIRKVTKKKHHTIFWRIFTILLVSFLMVFFFGAYVFYTNDTEYHERYFGKQDVRDLEDLFEN